MKEALVDLIVEAPGWGTALPDLEDIAQCAAELAVRARGLDQADLSVSLLACDDARIKTLNTDFRGRESATNVLSWPAFDLAPVTPGAVPEPPPESRPGARTFLGDVAIALQTCQREAKSASIPLKNHALHLILHGCLHLLGYDHETDEDSGVMEGIERHALMGLGISDPYA